MTNTTKKRRSSVDRNSVNWRRLGGQEYSMGHQQGSERGERVVKKEQGVVRMWQTVTEKVYRSKIKEIRQ